MSRPLQVKLLALVGAALLFLSACSSSPTSPTTAYAKLPDGRVLACLSAETYFGYNAYTCNWERPFSTDNLVPAGAEVVEIDQLYNFTLGDGTTAECFTTKLSYGYDVYSCDFKDPKE